MSSPLTSNMTSVPRSIISPIRTTLRTIHFISTAFHIQGLSELAMKYRDHLVLEAAPSGVEHLHTILEAIDRKVSIEFDYHSFNRQTVTHHEYIPCFLKTWEQRWYLVAEPLNRKNPTVYALERISNLRLTEQSVSPSPHINAQSYFEGCYGVNHEDCAPVLITLKVYGSQVDYVRARPIYASQEEVELGDGWGVFSYWLRPSYNFYQALLWHREKMEVLGPEEVRGEMKRIVDEISKIYPEEIM